MKQKREGIKERNSNKATIPQNRKKQKKKKRKGNSIDRGPGLVDLKPELRERKKKNARKSRQSLKIGVRGAQGNEISGAAEDDSPTVSKFKKRDCPRERGQGDENVKITLRGRKRMRSVCGKTGGGRVIKRGEVNRGGGTREKSQNSRSGEKKETKNQPFTRRKRKKKLKRREGILKKQLRVPKGVGGTGRD